jgi:glycosyltransferase involved in cell wall biosynthesis
MKVLYLYQYYKSRQGSGSTRAYEYVRRLRAAGHEVLVISSSARLLDFAGRRRLGIIEGEVDGVAVWAVPSKYSNRMGYVSRVVEFLRFAWMSSLAVLRAPRPDVIYASSTPLTVAIPALTGRIFRGIPLVFEVRDLWPEVPEGMGILRSRPLLAAAKGLAGLTYRLSAGIIALSPGMRDGILKYGIPRERIAVIPNGSDLDLFRPDLPGGPLRQKYGLEGAFVLVHTGAMGVVNGLDFLVPVCQVLNRTLPNAVICLVGEGGQRERLEAQARGANLANLRFYGPVPKDEVPAWLAAADVGLMLVRRLPILEMNSANKFFDYAAAGLPCLMNYGGWKADLLRKYGAGVAAETDDPEAFAAAITALAQDPGGLEAMGRSARRMAESEFDRDRQFAELQERLVLAAGRGKAVAPPP